MAVRGGQQWRAVDSVDVTVQTHWRAPYTGGHERTIPAGTVLTVLDDPLPQATAVGCTPAGYDDLESVLVPEEDRAAEKYDGYSLVVGLAAFGRELELVSG